MEVVVGIFVKVARWPPWVLENILAQDTLRRAEAVSPTPQGARRKYIIAAIVWVRSSFPNHPTIGSLLHRIQGPP
ncbi:hypothetical protein CaCOL14_010820 [Colletotrichum acutatum]